MMILVKKVEGRSVRQPEFGYRQMPAGEHNVAENNFYLRRIDDGDIERVKVNKSKPKPKPITENKEAGSKE